MKMKQLVVLALCALVVDAMVPRERRAETTGESTSSEASSQICQQRTPCGWSVYRPHTKIIEYNIQNTYCNCDTDKVCEVDEDDTTTNTFVLRCRVPEHQPSDSES